MFWLLLVAFCPIYMVVFCRRRCFRWMRRRSVGPMVMRGAKPLWSVEISGWLGAMKGPLREPLLFKDYCDPVPPNVQETVAQLRRTADVWPDLRRIYLYMDETIAIFPTVRERIAFGLYCRNRLFERSPTWASQLEKVDLLFSLKGEGTVTEHEHEVIHIPFQHVALDRVFADGGCNA